MREIVSSVTSKGQVTIPSLVRRHLGVGTPDKIAFVIDDDGVHLMPAPLTLDDLYGSVPALAGRETIDFEDQIAEAMDAEADRIVREMGGR